MILLTKLDNKKMLLNLDSVKYLESVPDTIIFFINGDSLMVKEPIEEVKGLIMEYQANIVSHADQKTT